MKERHMLFSNYQKTVIGGKEMGKYETLAKDIVKKCRRKRKRKHPSTTASQDFVLKSKITQK